MSPRRRPSRLSAAVALVAACSLTPFALAGCGSDGGPTTVGTFDIDLGSMVLLPAEITVPAGHLLLRIRNVDTLPHDFLVAGRGTPPLAPGASAEVTVDVQPGDYPMRCDLVGHESMRGTMHVVAAPTTAD